MDLIAAYESPEDDQAGRLPTGVSRGNVKRPERESKGFAGCGAVGYKSKRRKRQEGAPSPHSPQLPSVVPVQIDFNCTTNVPKQLHKYRLEPSRVARYRRRTLDSGHSRAVYRVVWGPSHGPSKHLLASCSLDATVCLYDAFSSNAPVCSLSHHAQGIKAMKWSLDGRHLLTAGLDQTVQYIDLATQKCLDKFEHDAGVSALAMHPENPHLFLAGADERDGIVCYDLRSKQLVLRYRRPGFHHHVQDLCFLSASGNRDEFVSSCCAPYRNATENTILVWDFRSGAVLSHQLMLEGFTCPAVRMHPTRREFVAQSSANAIHVFSSEAPYKQKKKKVFRGHHIVEGYHVQCDFSGDGKLLVTGDATGRMVFYDAESTKMVHSIQAHRTGTACVDVACHPQMPSTIATAGWDRKIHLYE